MRSVFCQRSYLCTSLKTTQSPHMHIHTHTHNKYSGTHSHTQTHTHTRNKYSGTHSHTQTHTHTHTHTHTQQSYNRHLCATVIPLPSFPGFTIQYVTQPRNSAQKLVGLPANFVENVFHSPDCASLVFDQLCFHCARIISLYSTNVFFKNHGQRSNKGTVRYDIVHACPNKFFQ